MCLRNSECSFAAVNLCRLSFIISIIQIRFSYLYFDADFEYVILQKQETAISRDLLFTVAILVHCFHHFFKCPQYSKYPEPAP